jgi:DNA-binding NtrC family response regulator
MKILVPEPVHAPTFVRIEQISLSVETFPPDAPHELDRETLDWIYLVPLNPEGEGAPLAALRVRLARANRFFLAVGSGLGSAAIVHACRDGAFDVLDIADSDDRWHAAIEAARRAQEAWVMLYGSQAESGSLGIVGESPGIRALRQSIERLGPTRASVLILGESGTGKERVAQGLHRTGGTGPLVAVNCAAIPRDLMEAELFGARKGAFTGATQDRAGLIEQAAGGTLFLDEVGDLESSLQPKLLRFLESRRARRVGGDAEYEADARVVSATNRHLEDAVRIGAFREDLFYRLSEVVLRIPPLRDRPEDIPLLVQYLVKGVNERFGKYFDQVEPELVRKMQAHRWPGNVRELKTALERLAIFHDGPVLRAGWWDPPEVSTPRPARSATVLPSSAPALAAPLSIFPSRKERWELAQRLLEESGQDFKWVAARLGVHPTTLFRWRKSGRV